MKVIIAFFIFASTDECLCARVWRFKHLDSLMIETTPKSRATTVMTRGDFQFRFQREKERERETTTAREILETRWSSPRLTSPLLLLLLGSLQHTRAKLREQQQQAQCSTCQSAAGAASAAKQKKKQQHQKLQQQQYQQQTRNSSNINCR